MISESNVKKWVFNFVLHSLWAAAFLYLWNNGNLHPESWSGIGVSLTALEMSIVILGLAGFGFVSVIAEKVAIAAAKPAADGAAREIATKIAAQVAEERVRIELPSMVRRILEEQEKTEQVLGSAASTHDQTLQNAINSLGKE
ncbi:hypothetical protein [Mesorhizobium sp. M1273]|uniref:hypothetical protein n=1 Tax=Mesorhizobium sp. M1273 TaxID=2957075 RepID=UPI00333901AD